VLVAALGALYRERAPRAQPASAPAAPVAASAAPAGGGRAEPAPSGPTTASAAPPVPALSGAPPADLDACVAAWFLPASFDPDTDLSFLCSECDGRRGTVKLRGAIVAGGKGKRVTPAMHEWARLGWFELPVYAALRASCCEGAPPIDLPRLAASSCTPPRDPVQALGAAAAAGGDLTSAIRAYRKAVSCLVEVGDFPAYGREGPIADGEETAFRAFAERGARR
jgi:hypothetical protein